MSNFKASLIRLKPPDLVAADVVAAFVEDMRKAGVAPLEPIESRLRSGCVFYFRAEGDKAYERKAWAVLHLDCHPAGAFGHFKAMPRQTWKFDGGPRLHRAELNALAHKVRKDGARREAELVAGQRAAADACQERWHQAGPVDPSHPYLVGKGITGECLRQAGERLLVPMFDIAGTLWNVQTIARDGAKRFAKGARQKGLHLIIGEVRQRLAVSEGYGTAAVIRRATGLPSVVAFSASNLTSTAQAVRARFQHADIIIGADDDAHLVDHPQIKRNLGLEAAYAAARAVGGRVAIPSRSPA